ncbi:hypothetical protein ACFL5K_03710, partial [Gemmatimonadota bacterium]
IYVIGEEKYPMWTALEKLVDIEKLPEYKKCIRVIKKSKIINNQIGKYIGTEFGGGLVGLKYLIRHIPITLLDRRCITDFKLAEFEIVYLKFEKALYSDKIYHTRITPIFGFESVSSSIKLEKGIEIKLLDEKTMNFLFRFGVVLGGQLQNTIMYTPRYGIFVSYELPKKICTHWGGLNTKQMSLPFKTGELEDKIFQSLRLIKEGQIYPSGTADITEPYPGMFGGGAVGLNKVTLPDKHWIGKRYHPLTKREETIFIANWRKIRKLDSNKYKNLNTGIRRFSIACGRESVEDKIIDLLICAEALFLGDSNMELSYKLSLRAAFFLAKNKDEREAIYKSMKKLYSIRSAIVHGNEPSPQNQSFEGKITDLTNKSNTAERYIRAAINKYIKLDLSKEDSAKYFDSLILGK